MTIENVHNDLTLMLEIEKETGDNLDIGDNALINHKVRSLLATDPTTYNIQQIREFLDNYDRLQVRSPVWRHCPLDICRGHYLLTQDKECAFCSELTIEISSESMAEDIWDSMKEMQKILPSS